MTTKTTKKYAALLRGINVGGAKKVPMAELREVLAGLGHTDVQTYLQSGNAVFASTEKDMAALARDLERAVEAHFGFAVRCLVVDGGYLRAVAEACPFPAAELEGRQLHATFLSEQPAEGGSPRSTGPRTSRRSTGSATGSSTSTPRTGWAVPNWARPSPSPPCSRASPRRPATGTPSPNSSS